MRILVNGLPYFSKRLVDDLNDYDPKNRYVFLNTYESFWDKLKFLFYLPFFDKVISMNGVSDESGSMNWALKWKKPLIMIWQGTDVVLAMDRVKDKTIYSQYINHARHYAVAPWLVDELATINIQAEILSFIWLEPKENDLRVAESFSVLTYLAKGREDFYGWNYIREASRSLADIEFYVIGSDGDGLGDFPNIHFCGWVGKEEMDELKEKSSVLVRMTEHDGYSHMVSEALASGLEVIWNYPHPITRMANDGISLISELKKLKAKFVETGGKKNRENMEWIKTNQNREVVLGNVIDKIKRA